MIEFNIKELINSEEYLKKFKVYNSPSLFEPDFKLLKKGRCPVCGIILRVPFEGKIAYCPSKKYKKHFVIGKEKLAVMQT